MQGTPDRDLFLGFVDMFQGSELYVMMSCHARSGNDVLRMRGVLELCTKDFGTNHFYVFQLCNQSISMFLLQNPFSMQLKLVAEKKHMELYPLFDIVCKF